MELGCCTCVAKIDAFIGICHTGASGCHRITTTTLIFVARVPLAMFLLRTLCFHCGLLLVGLLKGGLPTCQGRGSSKSPTSLSSKSDDFAVVPKITHGFPPCQRATQYQHYHLSYRRHSTTHHSMKQKGLF
jgi:hypothetical protein